MATRVESESEITFYGTVVIPAYVERHASGVLNFSKPRLMKLRMLYLFRLCMFVNHRHSNPEVGPGYRRVSVKCGNVECGMRKVKCGMKSAEWCVECGMRKTCNQGVLYCLLFAPAGSIAR